MRLRWHCLHLKWKVIDQAADQEGSENQKTHYIELERSIS